MKLRKIIRKKPSQSALDFANKAKQRFHKEKTTTDRRFHAENKGPFLNPRFAEYPFNTICRFIDAGYDNGKGIVASGVVISDFTILTAGHNLVHPDLEYLPSYSIVPGFDSSLNMQVYKKWDYELHPKWKAQDEFDDFYDLALVHTNKRLPEFIFPTPPSEVSDEDDFTMAFGYRAKKPERQSWGFGARIEEVASLLGYNVPTRRGQSGGAVFVLVGEDLPLIATHNGGAGVAEDEFVNKLNKGVQYTDEIYEWIVSKARFATENIA